jgi:anti-sigma regulatory factor (Ser/Thr protein kinase)
MLNLLASGRPLWAPELESRPLALPRDTGVVPAARETADLWVAYWGLAYLSPAVRLVTSELVTNAVQYGRGGEISLEVSRDASAVTIRVGDGNPEPPVPRLASAEGESGRGLLVVAAYSQEWGWKAEDSGEPGKCVWATII